MAIEGLIENVDSQIIKIRTKSLVYRHIDL